MAKSHINQDWSCIFINLGLLFLPLKLWVALIDGFNRYKFISPYSDVVAPEQICCILWGIFSSWRSFWDKGTFVCLPHSLNLSTWTCVSYIAGAHCIDLCRQIRPGKGAGFSIHVCYWTQITSLAQSTHLCPSPICPLICSAPCANSHAPAGLFCSVSVCGKPLAFQAVGQLFPQSQSALWHT